MNLRIFDDHEALSAAVADEIVRRVEKRPRSIVLLTGGSTARRAYELLGSMPRRPRIAAQPVVWVMIDERMVPSYHADSNGRMIQESLFSLGIPTGHQFVRFRTDLGDAARVAREFEAELRGAVGEDPIDLALLGVGPDGHTASLFPGTEVLEESERWAREVWVPRLDAWRVTVTLPVLRAANERWLIASGDEKRQIIGAIRDGADVPVARVIEGRESWWFVDRAAWDPEESLAAERGRR
ncbi:MAG TPA: 6-phosphogluconolactonase [Thermoanaerobaculia bacterium]|nr:6-phosphogluconolactonase [Thermoanaerobaculia bacterium]